jgi:hypothetical protein
VENQLVMSNEDIKKFSKGSVNIMNSDNYKNLIDKGIKLEKTILNLDNKGDGTHWTSIKPIDKKGDILYYEDSFGVIPPVNLKNKLVFYNPIKKQQDWEVNCGARSLNSLR